MGRHIKNATLASTSGAVLLPLGSNTIRPANPLDGHLTYNSSLQRIEYYMTGAWHPFAQAGKVTITKDIFSGNASATTFGPMSRSYISSEEAQALVFVNAVFQDPAVNYTFNGSSSITFTSTPPAGASIIVLHNFSSTIAQS